MTPYDIETLLWFMFGFIITIIAMSLFLYKDKKR